MPLGKKKNPVCVIWWRDAAYSYNKNFPEKMPPMQVTTGFIVSTTKKFTNIATNVNYNPKSNSLWPIDGFVIPEKVIKNSEK